MLKSCNASPIVLLLFLSLAETSLGVEAKIGGEIIHIPAPAGFVDVKTVSGPQYDLFQAMVPNTNRLEAAFVTERDAGMLMLDKQTNLNEYFMAQSSRHLDTAIVSKSQFAELREMLRREYSVMFKKQDRDINDQFRRSSRALSQRTGTEIKFNLNGVAPLSVDEESATHISTSLLSKLKIVVEGEQIDLVVAASMSYLLVKSKILYLYAFKTYQDNDDIEWTRREIKKWKSAVIAANETVWPVANGEIVPEGTVINPEIRAVLSGDFSEFRSKEHQKAQGLDFSLKLPIAWKSEEAERPHIVQKFLGPVDSHGIQPMVMVIVQKLPKGFSLILEDGDIEDLFSEGLKEMMPTGADYIDGGETKLDGETSGWMKYYYKQERAGMLLGMYCLQYVIIYEDKMMTIQCSVGGLENYRELSEELFISYLPLFQNIGNNFILYSKWNKPLFSRFWWIIIIALALLFWVLGLIPPLSKRPLFRKHSSANAAIQRDHSKITENPRYDNVSLNLITESQEESTVNCTTCGSEIPPTAKYCPNCGESVVNRLNIPVKTENTQQGDEDQVVVTKAAPSYKHRIGGWLAFYLFGLMLMKPLLGIASLSGSFMLEELETPAIISLPSWSTFKSVVWFIYIIVLIIGEYSGYLLLTKRHWSSVVFAKLNLWIMCVGAPILMWVIVPAIVLQAHTLKETPEIGSIIVGFLGILIWLPYFLKSKRVRAIYLKD